MSLNNSWFSITLTHAFAEELVAELSSNLQSPTIQIHSSTRVEISFLGNETDCESIKMLAGSMGFEIVHCQLVPKENTQPDKWYSKCEQLWQKITRGKLEIELVSEESLVQASSNCLQGTERSIKIVPGTGLGTGHHATTGMLLELMQRNYVIESHPDRILDFGTGSGILSIASSKLYPSARVIDAIDNDPLALENARLNLTANHCPVMINLIQGELDQINSKYNLILANIYAQAFIEYNKKLQLLLSKGGYLLISGISQHITHANSHGSKSEPILGDNSAEPVIQALTNSGWQLKERINQDEWVALSFFYDDRLV